MVRPVCRIPVSIGCAKRRATIDIFTHVLEGDKPIHHFPSFRPHIFLRAERCSRCRGSGVPAESSGTGGGGEVVSVSGCTRISSQGYVFTKSIPQVGYMR